MVESLIASNGSPTKKVAKKESDYWNGFYDKFAIAVPSQFCALVATEAQKSRPFVEFGCGNGRDAMYMAQQGFTVLAGDLSDHAIDEMQKKHTDNERKPEFVVCDVSNSNHVQSLVDKARAVALSNNNNDDDSGSQITFYNRFFLHALDDQQEAAFLTALSKATIPGDRLYMEYRCSLDAPLDKEHGKGHFRRYIETDNLVVLLKQLGFFVEYQITGQGMAKFKKEDPFVSRIICERQELDL